MWHVHCIAQSVLIYLRTNLTPQRPITKLTRDDNDNNNDTSFKPAFGPTQPLTQCVKAVVSSETKRRGVNLTTYLHRVERLLMHGAIPPLSDMPSWYGAYTEGRFCHLNK
jgi:hypothetical protein